MAELHKCVGDVINQSELTLWGTVYDNEWTPCTIQGIQRLQSAELLWMQGEFPSGEEIGRYEELLVKL